MSGLPIAHWRAKTGGAICGRKRKNGIITSQTMSAIECRGCLGRILRDRDLLIEYAYSVGGGMNARGDESCTSDEKLAAELERRFGSAANSSSWALAAFAEGARRGFADARAREREALPEPPAVPAPSGIVARILALS